MRIMRSMCLLLALIPLFTFEQTVTVDVDLVNIPFTVASERDKLVTNLNRENFRVFEDDRPQTITNFSREADVPLTIALVIDASGSVRDKLQAEKEAAIDFLYSTLRRGEDKALVLAFDTNVSLLQDYTDDATLLSKQLEGIRAGGGTALYNAVYFAVREKLAAEEGRRVVILISDGDDNCSRHSLEETLEWAQRNEVTIYAVSTNSMEPWRLSDRGSGILKTLADETGGTVFSPVKPDDLVANFKRISRELRAQYTLAYRSTNPRKDGSFRKVRIEVAGKRYTVRARPGYYAPGESAAQK